ncbi:MAG: TDT family transporter [Methanobrevibacter sp.]|uniref:TDT family transporter n=1 Tax=Methanobrevibacter sp. TaxID=66852 RepID=UPI0025E7F689|nr:TDT family transporter [Methanobrevibacter sp.]MBR6993583.1 TDT family transporter [Methanobrevibacter sp.]
MNIIKNIPIPITGLILALLSLGNLLQDIHPHVRYLFGAIGMVLIILVVLKVIQYPSDIKNDFKNPILVSSSGTFSMSLMLLSTYLSTFMPSIGYIIWIIGISLHILLMIYFTYNFIIRNFNITTVYPSYWIVFVGITMGAITAPVYGLEEIGFIFFMIGFIAMLVTTPVIIYRYARHNEIPDMNKPLICIFTALFSILIVGYLNSSKTLSLEFITVLYLLACLFYIFALYKLIEYRNLDFYPSFSAFTFPFVISAIATKGVLKTVSSNMALSLILTFETIISIVIVFYVLSEYMRFLKK